MGQCISTQSDTKSSFTEINEAAIYGYIRDAENEYKFYMILSEDLYLLISSFVNSIWKFDTVTEPWDAFSYDWIKNNGKTFIKAKDTRDCVTATSCKGFNHGIHELKVKYETPDTGWFNATRTAFCLVAGHIFFSSNSHEFIHRHDDIAYWMGPLGNVYSNEGGGAYFNDPLAKSGGQWRENTEITMILDCVEWKLTYRVNDRYSATINIEKHRTYFPCVTASSKGVQFTIIYSSTLQ